MAVEVLPVWSIPPDWAQPVVETPEWKTAVMTSVTGAEQRMALRTHPRRRIEYSMTAMDRWRTWYDSLLAVRPQTRYYVPIWHERSRTIADVAVAGGTLFIEGTRRELATCKYVFLQGRHPHQYEILEVTSGSPSDTFTELTLTTGAAQEWPAGTPVYPVASAIIEDKSSTDFTRAGSQAVQASVRFLYDKPMVWSPELSFDDYQGFPVIDLPTNEADDQMGGYDRLKDTLDSMSGVLEQVDLGGRAFEKYTSNTFYYGRLQNEYLRDLLWTLQGKLKEAWWVRPTDDFFLAVDAATDDTSITVIRGGYTDLVGVVEGRQDIRIRLRDGSVLYNRISSSAVLDDDTERLDLDVAIIAGFTVADVVDIRFMQLGRLDQDAIEMSHTTDADGVTAVSMAIRSAPDIRVADDWTPAPFPRTSMESCGGQQLWIRGIVDGVTSDWQGVGPDANPTLGIGGLDLLPYFALIDGVPIGFPGGAVIAPAFQVNGPGKITVNLVGPFVGVKPSGSAAFGGSLDPGRIGPDVVLSDSNNSMESGGETGQIAMAANDSSTRKGLLYWEFLIADAGDETTSMGFGLANVASSTNPGNDPAVASSLVAVNYFMPLFGPATGLPGDTTGAVFCIAVFY